jgi:cytochrome c oxidase assembly protein subunit 15
MAVVWQQSKAVLALHFGISMFAFTCTWLHYGWAARAASEHGKSPAVRTSRPGQSLSRSVFWFSLVTVIYCYGVVYLGAYIRHTGSGGACAGWPLCNGEVIPSAGGQAVAIAFAHRAAALLLLAVTAALVFYVRRRADAGSDAMRSARLAIVLVCLQILSGGLLVSTIGDHNLYVFTGLLHTIIISALFSVLCQLTLRTRNFFDS